MKVAESKVSEPHDFNWVFRERSDVRQIIALPSIVHLSKQTTSTSYTDGGTWYYKFSRVGQRYILQNFGRFKVQIFWEGHKNVCNNPYGFETYLVNVKSIRMIALIFVVFWEKLNLKSEMLGSLRGISPKKVQI